MSVKELLTSKTGNYLYIGIGLLISVPIILFLAPMFISMIMALFQPELVDTSKVLGMILLGAAIMLLPIYFISTICRMKHIYICKSGLCFSGHSVLWEDIKKITIYLGNSRQFTIAYKLENKTKKVFGSLMTFEKQTIIETLKKIAVDNNISISRRWY